MLFDDPKHDGWHPPDAIESFRCQVAAGLAGNWTADLVAYDDDVPKDLKYISAKVSATLGNIRVEVSRHAGSDAVFVRLRDHAPVPFEDLAVAKGTLDCSVLIGRATATDPDDESLVEPVIPFDQVLRLLRAWGRNSKTT